MRGLQVGLGREPPLQRMHRRRVLLWHGDSGSTDIADPTHGQELLLARGVARLGLAQRIAEHLHLRLSTTQS